VTRRSVVFAGPRDVCVEETPLPQPGPGQLLVETALSAISAGTEMLVYRDQFPPGMSVDLIIDSLGDAFTYPLHYGYAAVGRVAGQGAGVPEDWSGRLVFAFQPHTSHFLAAPADLIPVPQGISPEAAAFLPNVETAVNLLQDGAPLLGERVAVFGQGVVGLLTTSLLARFPLDRLVTVDSCANRRDASLEAGAHAALAPDELPGGDADLVYELSGNPAALNQAIAATGYGGRIVVGSWYGQRQASLDLGGRFHRDRIQIISSQVSTIAPHLRGRWDKPRRLAAAWRMVEQIEPQRWITHRFPITQAPAAYRLLDEQPSETIQVILTYG